MISSDSQTAKPFFLINLFYYIARYLSKYKCEFNVLSKKNFVLTKSPLSIHPNGFWYSILGLCFTFCEPYTREFDALFCPFRRYVNKVASCNLYSQTIEYIKYYKTASKKQINLRLPFLRLTDWFVLRRILHTRFLRLLFQFDTRQKQQKEEVVAICFAQRNIHKVLLNNIRTVLMAQFS